MDAPFNEKTLVLKLHQGRICIRFGVEHLERITTLNIGMYHPAWKCHVFNMDPFMAWRLIKEFKPFIAHADPEIKAAAMSYHEKQSVKSSDKLPDIPNMKRSAWGHQRQAYYFCLELDAAMLAMGMGCGKSMTAVALVQNREHDTTLIVCPKSVIPVWPLEFSRNATESFHIVQAIGKTGQQKRDIAENEYRMAKALKKPFVFIVNYETMWRDPLCDWIRKMTWDHIVYDESHRIKSASGKASRFAGTMVKRARRILQLTGTPMPHSPLDLYGQFRALNPAIFGTSNTSFKKRYAEMGGFGGTQVLRFINQEEMHLKFEQCAFRVTSDILDLPPVTHSHRVCELEPEALKVYMQMEEDLYTQIENEEITAANALVKILRLQQMTSGYVKTDSGEYVRVSKAKQTMFGDFVEDIDKDEPVVYFAVFRTDINAIKEELEKHGRSYAELSGQKNQLAEWQNGKMTDIIVQIRSGGVGVDLTRSCIQAYYSASHSMGDYLQSIARTHRPGQTRPVRFFHFVVKNTIDTKIYKALKKKEDAVKYVLETVKHKLNGGQDDDSEMFDDG